MHNIINKIEFIKSEIKRTIQKKQPKSQNPEIIAVSKTFPSEKILPLIKYGHIHFGENKIQEAEDKWVKLKEEYNHVKLHMVGKVQSNKAKKAVQLFDYIHSLDNAKLAEKISKFELQFNKKINIFIQVNLGNEEQKSGITKSDLKGFYDFCTKNLSLNIIGLMCIPPQNLDSVNYFNDLNNLAKTFNLSNLSMGMSHDYIEAINCGSTFVRIGEMIFGKRIIQ